MSADCAGLHSRGQNLYTYKNFKTRSEILIAQRGVNRIILCKFTSRLYGWKVYRSLALTHMRTVIAFIQLVS